MTVPAALAALSVIVKVAGLVGAQPLCASLPAPGCFGTPRAVQPGSILSDSHIKGLQPIDSELRAFEFCDEGQAKEALYLVRRINRAIRTRERAAQLVGWRRLMQTYPRNPRSAANHQPFSSCRAITMRWIWLVPS